MLTPSEYRCPTKVGARALLKLFEAPGRFAGKSLNYVRVRAVLITGLWPNDCPKDDFDAPGPVPAPCNPSPAADCSRQEARCWRLQGVGRAQSLSEG